MTKRCWGPGPPGDIWTKRFAGMADLAIPPWCSPWEVACCCCCCCCWPDPWNCCCCCPGRCTLSTRICNPIQKYIVIYRADVSPFLGQVKWHLQWLMGIVLLVLTRHRVARVDWVTLSCNLLQSKLRKNPFIQRGTFTCCWYSCC